MKLDNRQRLLQLFVCSVEGVISLQKLKKFFVAI